MTVLARPSPVPASPDRAIQPSHPFLPRRDSTRRARTTTPARPPAPYLDLPPVPLTRPRQPCPLHRPRITMPSQNLPAVPGLAIQALPDTHLGPTTQS